MIRIVASRCHASNNNNNTIPAYCTVRSRTEKDLAQINISSRAPSIFFSRYSNWTVYIPEHILA